jgi:dienelactone hydrolase
MTSCVHVRGLGLARLIAPALPLALAGTLAGCQSAPPTSPSAGAANHHAGAGYLGGRHDAVASTQDIWRLDDQPVEIVLLAPAQTGPHPLVIYLPGLGEGCSAGEAWRRTWAQAGYAVLCAQLPEVGEAVWGSERARSGDFVDIARDAYAAPALAKRVAAVRGLIDELRHRQETGGETPYAQIDLTRAAIGGFDLGAQTAMAVAGEAVSGIAAQPLPAGVKGVIALSPYANPAGKGLESAFRSVRLPVLLVTSDQDVDPYGLVTTASARRAAFEYLPAGKKFLLVLSGAPRSLLSGIQQPQAVGAVLPRGENASTDRWKRDSEGGDGQSGKRSNARQVLEALPPGETPARSWTLQLANIASVTTAYLDAVVKDDPAAAAWLTHGAKPWLGEQGDLQIK